MNEPAAANIPIERRDMLVFILAGAASVIGINQYLYGLYNHCITVPFLKSILDPALYPHDYLIAEKKYFYTCFLSVCALLVKATGISIPMLFFILYCLSLFAFILAVFLIALRLFQNKEIALLSVMLVIFSFTTLGEIRTVESLFMERTLALPVLLFAVWLFLGRRFIWSYVLLGIAFLFHPLSAAYAIAFLFACSVLSWRKIGISRLAACLLLLLAVASPVLYLKFKNPAPALHIFTPDAQWLELLRLRSAHHVFPLAWHWSLFAQSALFIAGFVITWKHKPEAWLHRTVLAACGTILLLCLAGIILTEVKPLTIVVQFQLFRSFPFLFYFALIYYVNFIYTESKNKSGILLSILVVILFAQIFYNDVTDKSPKKYLGFLVVLSGVFPGLLLIQSAKRKISEYYIPAMALLVFITGIGGYMARGKPLTLSNGDGNKEWLAVQRWAKANTSRDAVFIVPPKQEGFRVESERAIYGDWKDGTQMFFNPAFGTEWFRRMHMLGYEKGANIEERFKTLNETDFKKIADELKPSYQAIYLVTPPGKELSFSKKYHNGRFTIYGISPES